MSSLYYELDKIRTDLLIKRFTNEVDYINSSDNITDETKQRLEQINTIIKSLDATKPKRTKKDVIDAIEKNAYNVPWTKLNSTYKEHKLLEYLRQSHCVKPLDATEEMIENFVLYLKDKKTLGPKAVSNAVGRIKK